MMCLAGAWAMCPVVGSGPSKLTVGPADNHDIISLKLFQLMVEHTPEEENIDWTKIEPSVNFLKSPKGNVCAAPPSLAHGPSVLVRSGCGCGLGSWVSKPGVCFCLHLLLSKGQ